MKNFYLILFLMLFSFSLLSQTEIVVEEKQRSLIVKRTADWCPNCGTWGWSFFDSLIDENPETTSFIAAHHSGGLMTEEGLALTSDFGGSGQPNFFLAKDQISVNSGNWSAVKNSVKEEIDALYDNESPQAAVGLWMTFDVDSNIYLEGRTVFYQNLNSDIYVSLFLIENDVVWTQSGQGPEAVHQKILLNEVTGNPFGTLISEGPIESGTSVGIDLFSFPLDQNIDLFNFEIVAVLWEKNGEEYSYINAVTKSDFDEVPVSNKELLSKDAYQINPNISAESINIQLNALQKSAATEVKLFNLNGQLISQLYSGEVFGSQTIEVQKSALNLSAGTYLVNITMDGKVATEKVIFLD